MPKPINVLDVGGFEEFWEQMDFIDPASIELTILNLEKHESVRHNVRPIVGDARRMPFASGTFDFVFSNAVLEHVGTAQDQAAAAAEISRVGQRFLVMVPNRSWPLEVHTLLPVFQFWPRWLQHVVLRRTWRFTHFNDVEHALRVMDETRLPSVDEMKRWFPTASFKNERFWGVTKTLIACR